MSAARSNTSDQEEPAAINLSLRSDGGHTTHGQAVPMEATSAETDSVQTTASSTSTPVGNVAVPSLPVMVVPSKPAAASPRPAPPASETVLLPVLPVIPAIHTTNIVLPAGQVNVSSPKPPTTTKAPPPREILPKGTGDAADNSNSAEASTLNSTPAPNVKLSARLR